MSSKKAKYFWVLLLLLLAAGGFAYYQSEQKTDASQKVVIETVTHGTIEETVTAQGTLEPRDYVDVGVQVSGQLKKLYVDVGDTVKEGDLLAEIDPKTYESQLKADQASVKALLAQKAQEEAQADYDRLKFKRYKKLLKTKAISQQEAEEAEKALKVSEATITALEAQIEQAEANVETDQINLGYTKIYAPMDGIISEKDAEEGETLNANQTTPTVVQIANLDVMTVSAQIAEADIMLLKKGTESEFVTLGSSGRKWRGEIRQILPTPEEVNDVILYDALIDIDNKDRALMNGMSTQNTFIIGRAQDVLVIPTKALGKHVTEHDDEDKGEAYLVRVIKGENEVEQREVYIGLMTRKKAEVRSGLQAGERILVSGEISTRREDRGPRMIGGL